MERPPDLLAAGIAALRVAVPAGFAARARVYLAELARWNRVSRLTGYRTDAEHVVHVVLDSLLWLGALPAPSAPLLDVGSGAGVPGLVLKLARPEWAVTLVEANRRRANFLRHMARELDLADLRIEEARAETLGESPTHRGAFRTVTMRAVTAPERASALARPFLAPGGWLVMTLGPRARPSMGSIREAALVEPALGLRLRRRFLIIGVGETAGDVPRGTRGGRGP